MGPQPPWSPEAPPKSVQRTLRAPPCLAPIGVAAGASPRPEPLVGWGYVTSVPARPCLAVSCCSTCARFAGGGGVGVPPSSLEGLASAYRRLLATLGPLS